MKKILVTIALLAFAGIASATGYGSSSAGSISGAGAATGSAAGGYTYGNQGLSASGQSSAAGAYNNTGAGSYNSGRGYGSRSVGSEAHSEGSTYSASGGRTVGQNAGGVTGGIAAQGGIAGARSSGVVMDRTGFGVVGTRSGAAAGSVSVTANRDTGRSYNDAWSGAGSTNDASLRISNGSAEHTVDSASYAYGGSNGRARNAVQAGAGGGIAGGYSASGAITRGGHYSGSNPE